jgi:hypothetical protein
MRLGFAGPISKHLNPLTWVAAMATRIPLRVKTP